MAKDERVEKMDLLGMARQAGFSRAAMHGITRTVWKDGIDIDEPCYSIKAFASMVLDAAATEKQ